MFDTLLIGDVQIGIDRAVHKVVTVISETQPAEVTVNVQAAASTLNRP